jgi:uncharacterized membrane protein YuzA (DUF378 family)
MIGFTIRIIAVFFVLIGGINWGLTALDYNIVEKINRMLSDKFHTRLRLDKFVYIVVGLCALGLLFDRTTWLPFLGESVLPGTLVPLKAHTGNTQVKVNVSPGAKVAYWSAMPGDNPDIDVRDAYAKFGNSGVVMADGEGVATLSFDKGTDYVVPSGKSITSHVHYREFNDEYGMMGPIGTVYV